MKTSMTLPVCTVGYLVRGEKGIEEIFLGEKAATPKAIKRKIAGKLIGYGGDVEPDDESIAHSFARELSEESGFSARPENIETVARILIKDEKGDRLTLYWVFARHWTGTVGDSREILDGTWYPVDPLPDNILDADKIVLPRIIRGEKLSGWIRYDANMNVVDHELVSVEEL